MGYKVNVGDTFCFSPWFLGRDPTNWKNANIFDPQRWIDDPMNGGATSKLVRLARYLLVPVLEDV